VSAPEPDVAAAGAPPRRAPGMYSPLSAIVRREPVTVPLEATVREALETMERMRVGSIVVADGRTRFPLGIFTLQDLLRRVTLPGGDLAQPIACVMTSGLITLGPQATAHQAALTMARNGVRHVVVVDGEGRLAGVVSQNDLFGLQRVGVKDVSNDIRAASDVAGLARAAAAIRRLTGGLLSQGIGAETLTHYISTLNDLLTMRVIELTADEHDLPPVPMCWIALGSEGRLEQTFSTDQDNGIIFEADEAEAEEVRAGLLPFARAVNAKLDACGFTLCKGEIMAGNPRWCQTLAAWQSTFARWIYEPEPEALLNAAIFFDLRPIQGRESLAERLREWMLGAAGDHPLFLRLMAENALSCQPPLGTFRDFVYDRSKEFPRTIELKAQGARPFVDAARILALANGVPHTSTAERLRAVAERSGFDDDALAGIVDGFYVVHLMRLRNQMRPRASPAAANRVDPQELNDIDRQVLKEAFRQARKLQGRLVTQYRLRG
jgi:CBS domain-containing protein